MTEKPRSWDSELKTALRGVRESAGSMHITPKETVEEVTWPSWKIWVSSCSDSTFCPPPPIPRHPSAMCFLANTAGPIPLGPSVHKQSQRLQGKEVCRWVVHVCLWALKTTPLLLRSLAAFTCESCRGLYVPIPDVGEVTIQTERKRAVWSSHLFIIHYWAWSRSLRGSVPGWRRVSSRRWFGWVSERNELFEHFQGNGVRQKLRDRLRDLCEL